MAVEMVAGYSLAHNNLENVPKVPAVKIATSFSDGSYDPLNPHDMDLCRLQMLYEASYKYYFHDPEAPKSLFLEYQNTVNANRTIAYLGYFAVEVGNCLRASYKSHLDVFAKCEKGEFLHKKRCIPELAHAMAQMTLYGHLFWNALPGASYYHEIKNALKTLFVNRGVYLAGLAPLGKEMLQELCP